MDPIPETIEEIYARSNLNKLRAKDKKRGREGNEEDEPVDSSMEVDITALNAFAAEHPAADDGYSEAVLGARSFDSSAYFRRSLIPNQEKETVQTV